jgi:pyruvate,water dikinase
MPETAYILPFSKIDKHDTPLVGGKGANLGEMTKVGLPVPPGFAITVPAYDAFLRENNLADRIYKTLTTINYSNNSELEAASHTIRNLILKAKIPNYISRDIISHYKKLSGVFSNALVAVRSSATAEDMPGTSFAGQQITFLNVKGEANVCENVKECWASLFTGRSIYYRYINKLAHDKVKISVVVQKMIQSEVSGVMFSIDPVSNQKDRIIIESVWGLGEMIVQGSVIPDKYVVQKETFSILSKEISDQSIELIKVNGENKEKHVPKNQIDKQKITDADIIALAKISDKLQKHYYFPQDSEWAKEKGKLYLIQTRPVTTLSTKSKTIQIENSNKEYKVADVPILVGSPASPGSAAGPVKIIRSPKEIDKVKPGDVLVAPMTSPDLVPAMKRSAAIVTDEGGQTSHAAIVSRELGIPCVVGTREATKQLHDGEIISVNGSTGEVFMGSNVQKIATAKEVYADSDIKTATKVYVNLAEPELAHEVAKLPVDGVGLLRAEFMIGGIGIHPKEAIKMKTQDKFIDKLAADIAIFCKEFYPRPVVYRATDFKTNEYRSLKGGKYWEPIEPNPLLGFRGAFRYVSSPEVFNLELSAIKKVRKQYKNLWMMIPFVRSPQELRAVRKLVASEGLFEDTSFKFWMMAELPVNVIMLEEFIKVGIDGISIGSNDLTMLLLGTDRDNAEVAREFDERSPAVFWALEHIVKTCHKYGITASICGQAASTYNDLVERLIKFGVTSVSVNPDAVGRVKHIISEAERKIANGENK